MNIVVSILDSDNNTDNIVLVNTTKKTLTWIPRDVYSFYLRHRINCAYRRGGHELLLMMLQKLGFQSDYSICVSNEVTRAVLANYKITVPVEHSADYYYPVKAFEPIENGKKIVSFRPPYEILTGERIHQFLGARYRVNYSEYIDLPDFERLSRQILFIRQMLIEGFDFRVFLSQKISISHPHAVDLLSRVDTSYTCSIYRKLRPFNIKGMSVLIMKERPIMNLKILLLKMYYCLRAALKIVKNG